MGKPFDVSDPPTGTTYIGRCVGKQLFISDVVKYLPPDRASDLEAPKHHGTRHMLAKPSAQTSKVLTLYGENSFKTDPVSVFFGSAPSSFVDVRCSEVLGCLPPEQQTTKRRPIILVRGDGVVFPSSVMYPWFPRVCVNPLFLASVSLLYLLSCFRLGSVAYHNRTWAWAGGLCSRKRERIGCRAL